MVNHIASSAGAPAALPESSRTSAGTSSSEPDFYALFSPIWSEGAAAAPSAAPQVAPEQSSSQADSTQANSTQTTTASPAAAQQNFTSESLTSTATPSLASEFGAQVFMSNPGGTGPGGAKWNYNPIYFATQATAEKVASLVGGTVVEKNDIVSGGGPFQQNMPNELIQFSDGRRVNAGLIANLFNHGYSQSYIDSQLQAITDGDQV